MSDNCVIGCEIFARFKGEVSLRRKKVFYEPGFVGLPTRPGLRAAKKMGLSFHSPCAHAVKTILFFFSIFLPTAAWVLFAIAFWGNAGVCDRP